MPTPHKGETREHYLKRAIPMIEGEGLKPKQAVGKAEGMFDNAKRSKGSVVRMTHAGEEEWVGFNEKTPNATGGASGGYEGNLQQ